MRRLAPAKINLTLELLGIRPDGFTEIDSLLMPVSLYDELLLEAASDGVTTLRVTHDPAINLGELGDPEANLVMRALRLVERRVGRELAVSIHLHKRIPLGAGLGGGSSDCAAMLHALNDTFALGLSMEQLVDIAAQLGSDIPAFIIGGLVRMQGRGESVTSIAPFPVLESQSIVLVNCGAHCTTGLVYQDARAQLLTLPPAKATADIIAHPPADLDSLAGSLRNDLEAAAFGRFVEVSASAELLRQTGAARVLLSGSGATVFGLFADAQAAHVAQQTLRASYPMCWTTSFAQYI